MPRTNTVVVSALNIVMSPPHSRDRYRDMWMRAVELAIPVRLRGESGGVIGSAIIDERRRGHPITGDLYKFVNVELEGGWLDLSTRKRATKDTVARQVRIPPTLRPNLRSVPYIFVPTKHRLIYLSHVSHKNSLSPEMARTLIEQTLRHGALIEQFGKVEVTVEPDHQTLQKIFRLPRLKYLHVEVVPPNALGALERKVFRRMASLNADKLTEEIQSTHPEGLQLDEATKALAHVGASNGIVKARGETESGRVETYSTMDHPLSEKLVFDPNTTTARETLEQEAPRIAAQISDREENGI